MGFVLALVALGAALLMTVPAYVLSRAVKSREIRAGWSASKGLIVFATGVVVLAWIAGVIAAIYVEMDQGVSREAMSVLDIIKWYGALSAFLAIFTVVPIVVAGLIGRAHAAETTKE